MSFFLSSQEVNYLFSTNVSFKTVEKRKNVSSHCTLKADSVQWLSQSDYSICISILVAANKYHMFKESLYYAYGIVKVSKSYLEAWLDCYSLSQPFRLSNSRQSVCKRNSYFLITRNLPITVMYPRYFDSPT